jgi:putative ABC transport system ATP-binding protein
VSASDSPIVRAVALRREYRMGDSVVHALDGVDLEIQRGEFVSITGASGSGKSTLMHLLGCLDRPTSGTLELSGQLVSHMTDKQLAEVRNRQIGFVFQTFNLINRTSALDNVLVPLMYTRHSFTKEPARKALEKVGLLARARHRPSEMSGGECQRVAIARAIVNSPSLVLADEPTGNLDSRTSEQIMAVFHQLRAEGITIVLVTHETDIAVQADRKIHMRDGKIVEDVLVDNRHREEILSKAHDAHRQRIRPTPGGPDRPPLAIARKTGTTS